MAAKHSLTHKLLVLGQFVFSAWIILGGGAPWGSPLPMLLAVAGFLVAVWAIQTMGVRQLSTMPTPRPGMTLVDRGPYHWIRHPMYTGLALFCGGFVAAHPSLWRCGMFMALLAILYLKSVHEEQALQASVAGYRAYRQRTKRWLPFIW